MFKLEYLVQEKPGKIYFFGEMCMFSFYMIYTWHWIQLKIVCKIKFTLKSANMWPKIINVTRKVQVNREVSSKWPQLIDFSKHKHGYNAAIFTNMQVSSALAHILSTNRWLVKALVSKVVGDGRYMSNATVLCPSGRYCLDWILSFIIQKNKKVVLKTFWLINSKIANYFLLELKI